MNGVFLPISPFSQGSECHTFFTALYPVHAPGGVRYYTTTSARPFHSALNFPKPRSHFLQSLHPTAPDLERCLILPGEKRIHLLLFFKYLVIKISSPRETCYGYKIDKHRQARHRQAGKGSNTKISCTKQDYVKALSV